MDSATVAPPLRKPRSLARFTATVVAMPKAVVVLTGTAGVNGTITFTEEGDGALVRCTAPLLERWTRSHLARLSCLRTRLLPLLRAAASWRPGGGGRSPHPRVYVQLTDLGAGGAQAPS